MKTSTYFQNKLQELKNEQVYLINTFGKRKKSVRARIHEINKEWSAIKLEWRETCGLTFSE